MMTFEIEIGLVETWEPMSKLILTTQISLVKSDDVEQVLQFSTSVEVRPGNVSLSANSGSGVDARSGEPL